VLIGWSVSSWKTSGEFKNTDFIGGGDGSKMQHPDCNTPISTVEETRLKCWSRNCGTRTTPGPSRATKVLPHITRHNPAADPASPTWWINYYIKLLQSRTMATRPRILGRLTDMYRLEYLKGELSRMSAAADQSAPNCKVGAIAHTCELSTLGSCCQRICSGR
jgi:hypothetical protein